MFCGREAQDGQESIRSREHVDMTQHQDRLAEFDQITMDGPHDYGAMRCKAIRLDVEEPPQTSIGILDNDPASNANTVNPEQPVLERIGVELRQFVHARMNDLNPRRLRWT